ncbi:MAG: hypothetical protein AB1Z67_07120 [Candidatus Limnocylindrales bacterium]
MSRRQALAALAAGLLLLPSAVAAQDTEADELPEPGTVLEGGRYTSDFVGPVIEFEAGDEWVVGPSGSGPIFTLEYVAAPGSVLSFTRFDGETFLDSCDPSSMTLVEPGVSRLAEIIAGNPYLNAGPPQIVEIGGFSGLQLDVGVPTYAECALPYVLIWAIPVGEGGEFVQMANQQSRFIVLDVGGDVIVVAIETFPGVPFGGFLDAAGELLDSVRITPGEYVPPSPTASPLPETTPSPEATRAPTPPPGDGASA